MPTVIRYYALKPGKPDLAKEPTGLFRTVETDTTYDTERFDKGQWVSDSGLLKYLIGEQGAELIDESKVAEVIRRLSGVTGGSGR